MKSFFYKVLRFLHNEDGPTAMESALFFGLVVALCLVSAKMTTKNLAGEPMVNPSISRTFSDER